MQAEFRAPRARNRVREEYEAPLPVPQSPGEGIHFSAQLFNHHVLVCEPEHIHKIYNQGYFGKGIFSSARPDHSISDQWEQREGVCLPVVTQARYEELLKLAGAALSAKGLDKAAVEHILLRLSQPVEMEDVRKELEMMELEAEHGVHSNKKGLQHGSQDELDGDGGYSCSVPLSNMNPETQLEPSMCERLDSDSSSDQDSDSGSDSDSNSGTVHNPLTPSLRFVMVSDSNECGQALVLPQVRRTPFSVTEYLQLSLEEAFFLVYSLGCLSVYLDQEPFSVIQLWQKFRSLRSDFVSSFAAYQHFRSKGWIPKTGSGAKYGVDLMLYRKGPPFYHSSYSVVIERVDDDFSGSALRPFTWRSLSALHRITANVSKEMMLCYIIYPSDLSKAELDSPICLSRLTVQEVIVSRWVSSKERAEQDDLSDG